MSCAVESTAIWEGNSLVVLARVVGVDQAVITQASTTSISRRIVNLLTSAVVSTTVLVKTTVISDSLLLTNGWTKDATGYNFIDTITGATNFAAGDAKHQIEYTIVDSSSLPNVFAFPVFVKNLI